LRGDDYSGTVLNRTARVMAAGHDGQVLLEGSTAGLLSEVELISLGPRRLRDIAKPVQLFQVQSAGLPIEFPPLRTADRTPGISEHETPPSSDARSNLPIWRRCSKHTSW
jgi:hypothetical protein